MTLTVNELMSMLTYEGLFDYVTVPDFIGQRIKEEDPNEEVTHVEFVVNRCDVWWSREWKKELDRRKILQETKPVKIKTTTQASNNNMAILAQMLKNMK